MRALALFSGGLDSMLAVRTVAAQGVEVIALFIDIGFGSKRTLADKIAARAMQAGAVQCDIVDTQAQFVREILFSPRYGYGKHFNPCVDCHGNMVRIAKELLGRFGAQFVLTGEVVGQRPMSQRAQAIREVNILARDLEERLVVRPLCAKVLAPTYPEEQEWIDRERLLDITGRGRSRQMALAAEYGFEEFESPGGGCLLTDMHYTAKIRDILAHEGAFALEDIALLKAGRHLRLPEGAKLVIGKEEADNAAIEAITHPAYHHAFLPDAIGPSCMLSCGATPADMELAARLIATYGKTSKTEPSLVQIGSTQLLVYPFAGKEAAKPYFIQG